jgi:hypothetical protein
MSRSHKKFNITTDHRARSTRWFKRQASKKVRRSMKSVNLYGGLYKRLYDEYNICDYRFWNTDPKYLRK